MELFEKLGIDWRLLIAQLVNFLILMGALTFLLYKPLMGALDRRRQKVAESLENAEKIGAELKRVSEESARTVGEARAEAQRIVTEAAKQAEATRQATLDKAKAEVGAIVAAGKAQLAAERDAMAAEVRQAAAGLVAAAVEKVIGEKVTAAKDKHLIEQALDNA